MVYSRPAITALVAVNLVPLAGIFAFDWGLNSVIFLYLIENIVIGLYSIAKMLLASKGGSLGGTRGYKVLFFLAHYSTFVVFHGTFLSFFLFRSEGRALVFDFLYPLAIGLYIFSHGVSLKENFFGKHENKKVTSLEQMWMPYRRVVPTHAGLIVFSSLVLLAGQAKLSIAVVVCLKIVMDLAAHCAIHRRIGRGPAMAGKRETEAR